MKFFLPSDRAINLIQFLLNVLAFIMAIHKQP